MLKRKDGSPGPHATMLERLGLNLNAPTNGAALSCKTGSCASVHVGPHPGYSAAVSAFLTKVESKNISDVAKAKLVEEGINAAKARFGGSSGLPVRPLDGATQAMWAKVFESVL